MKKHKQFNISTTPFNTDLLSGLLWELDIEGINELDNYLIIFANQESNISKATINNLLDNAKKENLIESFTIDEYSLEEVNWNEEWEKKINVIEISDKLAIKPTFREYNPKKGQLVITIDPKMSFGTGEHETTRIVLQLLYKYISNAKTVLDIGSGTGILSIASSLFGAEKVIGIDNDEWCLENGLENVKLNKVEDKVEIRLAEIDTIQNQHFDLILANINKHILVNIAESISTLTEKNSTIILSGLLLTDREDILKIYQQYKLELIDEKQIGEWIGLVLKKM